MNFHLTVFHMYHFVRGKLQIHFWAMVKWWMMKWNTWHIKSESNTSILLIYCGLFSYYQLIPLSIILRFLVKSRVEPKILHYISGTLTYHSFSGPPKYHSLIASHPVEPHPTDQICLELYKSLNLTISSCVLNSLLYTTNQCFTCMFHRPPMIRINTKMINFLCNWLNYVVPSIGVWGC